MTQPVIKKGALDVGTGANQVVALDGSGNLPAINGSALTNVDAATLGGQPVGTGALDIVARDGSGNIDADTLGSFSIGTGANNIVQLNGSSELPAVSGANLTNLPLGGRNGASVTRSNGAFTFGLTNGSRSVVDWDVESYDDNAFHDNVTNPSRLTVPSGVTKIQLNALIVFTSNINGQRAARFLKNGSTSLMSEMITGLEAWSVANDIPSLAVTTIQLQSPVIDCVATDYFEIEAGVFNATGWSDGVNGITRNSFFQIQVVE